MDVPAPTSAKKAGRASKGPSRVATPAKTPKSVKATPTKANSAKAAGGRKRKAEDDADEPAAKRSGRGRATAAAAREGIKEASKKRARAAPGTVKEARLHLSSLFCLQYCARSSSLTIFVLGSRHPKPLEVDLAGSPKSRRRSPLARSTRSRKSWTTEWTPTRSRPCSWLSGKATSRRTTRGSQRRI